MNNNIDNDIQPKIEAYNIALAMLASAANQCKTTKIPDYSLIEVLPSLVSALNDVAIRARDVEKLRDGFRSKLGINDQFYVIIRSASDYLFNDAGELLMKGVCGEYVWDNALCKQLGKSIVADIGDQIVLTGCKDPQGFEANLWTIVSPANVVRCRTLKEVVDELYKLGFLADHCTTIEYEDKLIEALILNPSQ